MRGTRVKLLGPSHLEHIRVDLTNLPDARFGDQVLLIGEQGKERITHQEIADVWGSYIIGLYALLRDHIPRIYI